MKKDASVKIMPKKAKGVLWGTIVGIVLSVLLTAVMSFAFVKMETVPSSAAVPCAMAALGIGAFMGGYVSARITKSTGMLVGAGCGFFVFVVLLGLCCAVGSEIGIDTIFRLLLSVLSGALGGVLGVNKKKRRK